jgi:hypothetical protein
MVAQSTAAIMLQFYTRNYLKPPHIDSYGANTFGVATLYGQTEHCYIITAFILPPWQCKCPGWVWARVLRHVLLTSGWVIWYVSLLFRVQSKYTAASTSSHCLKVIHIFK